jgi:hypothetical protein
MRTRCAAWIGAFLAVIGSCVVDKNGDCPSEAAALRAQVVAGRVGSDGSVTFYGTLSLVGSAIEPDGGPVELTVRAVYLAGIEVTPDGDGFNFRTWTVTVPPDRLAAFADGGIARVPVTAYLYGNCFYEMPEAELPIVRLPSSDAGVAPDVIDDQASPDDR